MKQNDEKWAIFWCDLLKPIIFSDIEPEGVQAYLKTLAIKEVCYPNDRMGRPSLSTLRHKLKKYQNGGFYALKRKVRADRGTGRNLEKEILAAAIALKKEQPYRSDRVINHFILSALIDCHSRYVVQARYYLRQNIDVLIDTMIRALSVHGAPLGIYLDNAKVYHSQGMKSACYRINTRLIHRPGDGVRDFGIEKNDIAMRTAITPYQN